MGMHEEFYQQDGAHCLCSFYRPLHYLIVNFYPLSCCLNIRCYLQLLRSFPARFIV